MKVLVSFECVHGGSGWGATGATQQIQINAEHSWEAVVKVAQHTKPGGWQISKLELLSVPGEG